jgi:5-methylcytosine-specific restriction endonuclease McrA
MSATATLKTCGTCGKVKPVVAFGKRKASSDGLNARCRSCRSAYGAAHADVVRERNASYRASNLDRERERVATWKQANPDRLAVHGSRRRARIAGGESAQYSRAEIFARWGGRCCYCDSEATALDHVTPIARQGADAPHNLVPACTPCNSSKGAKPLAEWARTF